ncbi:hypothetical protein HY946_01300 [Candidatus Gottesmanbacteria bacterium]|nr:hypothetical protein [Candidatus Gottesmanbacteria bacterium]
MKIKNSINPRSFIVASTLFLLFILAPSVLALDRPYNSAGRLKTATHSAIETQNERRQLRQNRLTNAKLKACQARENAIKKRTEHLGQLANTMMEKFDAIARRVEEYYTTKMVPGGKTVVNYDGLLSDIQTKKGAVQTALSQTQANTSSFACTSADPKGQLTQFKDDMQAVIKAFKDYKTSLKNLIVAVRSVTGTTERTSLSPSPKPTGNQGENE